MKTFDEWSKGLIVTDQVSNKIAYEAGQRSALPELTEEEWELLTRCHIMNPKITEAKMTVRQRVINHALKQRERINS